LRSSLRRLAAALLLATGIVASAALLGACGSEQNEDDVEGLLDRAFRQSIERADIKIEAQVRLEGLPAFERPLRLEAAGPYVGGGGRAPTLDIDLTVGAQGAGQTVQFGLLRTADRAFVKFGGEFYEQPRSEVRRSNRELGHAGPRGTGTLRELGLDPRTWVVGAREEDSKEVAGVESRHVSGKLDTRSMLRDLNQLVGRSASAIGRAPTDVPDPLSSREIDQLEEIVGTPSFDVYVGRRDEVVRRLSAVLEIRVPEKDRARLGGLERGAVRFSIEFDLEGEQRIEAPAKARPIAELTTQLGGLGALGGVGALGGGSGGGSTPDPEPPRPRGPGGERGLGGEAEGVEAVRRYSDCLDKADPDDAKALSLCAELLRQRP